MRIFTLVFAVGLLFAATPNPTIIQTSPYIPASLVVFADKGDLTYCVATPSKTLPQLSLTCRRSGVTKLQPTIISETTVIGIGDVLWMFQFDSANPKLVHFSASVNVRETVNGAYITSILKTQGNALWK